MSETVTLETQTAPCTECVGAWPWRRFLARGLDMGLCMAMVRVAAEGVLRLQLIGNLYLLQWLLNLAALAVLFLLEPLFLSRFGATPGKALLGLRLQKRNADGTLRGFTFAEAAARLWGVALRGEGFYVPLLSLWLNWRAYQRAAGGEPQPWDQPCGGEAATVYTARKPSPLHAAGFVLAWAAVLALSLGAQLLALRLPNRGALTMAQYVQNYNTAARYFEHQGGFAFQSGEGPLGQQGDFTPEALSAILLPPETALDYEYGLQDGRVEKIALKTELSREDYYLGNLPGQLSCAVCAVSGELPRQQTIGTVKPELYELFRTGEGKNFSGTAQGWNLTFIYEPTERYNAAGELLYTVGFVLQKEPEPA